MIARLFKHKKGEIIITNVAKYTTGVDCTVYAGAANVSNGFSHVSTTLSICYTYS